MQSAVQIQSPITVIKELLDNAIDANARNVSVIIIDNGLTQISVQDDGTGIDSDGLQLLGTQQATSKPQDQSCQGFRGEALFVINVVSTLTIKSRIKSQSLGNELNFKTGVIHSCGCEQGTLVVCNNLFNTLPIRYEYFKRQNQSLTKQIHKFLFHYQLAFRKLRIKAIVNGNIIFNTQYEEIDSRELKDIYTDIFLNENHQDVDKFTSLDKSTPDIQLQGFMSNAAGGVDKHIPTKNLYIIINGRPCQCPAITTSLTQTFQKFSAMRHPVGCLEITVAKGEADFNVSADKLEVKLRYQNRVCQFIEQAYEEHLKAETLTRLNQQDRKNNTYKLNSIQRADTAQKLSSLLHGKTNSQISQMRSNLITVLNKHISPVSVQNNQQVPIQTTNQRKPSINNQLNYINNRNLASDKESQQIKQLQNPVQQESSSTVSFVDSDVQTQCSVLTESQIYSQSQMTVSPEFDKLAFLSQTQPQQDIQKQVHELHNDMSNVFDKDMINDKQQSQSVDTQADISLIIDQILDTTIQDPLRELKNMVFEYNIDESSEELAQAITQTQTLNTQQSQNALSQSYPSFDSPTQEMNDEISESAEQDDQEQFSANFIVQQRTIEQNIRKTFMSAKPSQANPNLFSELNLIGQYNNSFIITTNYSNQIFLLDQHSLEESIIYNGLLQKLKRGDLVQAQKLLQPEQLCLSIEESAILAQIADLAVFNSYGFSITKTSSQNTRQSQDIRQSNYFITSKGLIDRQLLSQEELKEILSQFGDGIEVPVPLKIHRILANRACKSAVKLGDPMTHVEMAKLLKRAADDGRCFNCPHGRPSIQVLFQ